MTGVVASAWTTPGWMIVVVSRASWQPPQTAAPPAGTEIHWDSTLTSTPKRSNGTRRTGTRDGMSAAHELSLSTAALPRKVEPSFSDEPKSMKPSSPEKPSRTETPTAVSGSVPRDVTCTFRPPTRAALSEQPLGVAGWTAAGAGRGASTIGSTSHLAAVL